MVGLYSRWTAWAFQFLARPGLWALLITVVNLLSLPSLMSLSFLRSLTSAFAFPFYSEVWIVLSVLNSFCWNVKIKEGGLSVFTENLYRRIICLKYFKKCPLIISSRLSGVKKDFLNFYSLYICLQHVTAKAIMICRYCWILLLAFICCFFLSCSPFFIKFLKLLLSIGRCNMLYYLVYSCLRYLL